MQIGAKMEFHEENFCDRHKTAKFANVFSLEIFPLYGSQFGKHFEFLAQILKLRNGARAFLKPMTFTCSLYSIC